MADAESLYTEDIKDLREKTEKGYVKEKLKIALFGGFEKNAVLGFVDELRDRELKTRETFTNRIDELAAALESAQNEAIALKAELEKTNELRSKAEKEVNELRCECGAMEVKITHDARSIAEFTQKCSEYESQVESLRVDYEEVQTAKKYQAQYEDLESVYNEVVRSRDEYVKSNTALLQENDDIKRQAEKLGRDNEQLNKNLSDLTVKVRNAGLSAGMKLNAYEERQKYQLASLLNYAENSLKCLNEMETHDGDFTEGLRNDLEVLRSI